MLKKSILIPVIAVAASGIVLFGATQMVHAQTPDKEPFSGVAQAIAQKFNLNQTDVQSIINQQMKTNMQNRMQNHLDQLVKNGKITSTQEQAIKDEIAKIKSEYSADSFKNMTADQRKQAMQKMRDEIKSWAQSQEIDEKYLMPAFGMFPKGHGFMGKPVTSPTPTS